MKPIFRGGVPRLTFILLLLLALGLVVADLNGARTQNVRTYLSLMLTPVQWLVDLPSRFANNVSGVLVDRKVLVAENDTLRSESIVLERKVQQMASLMVENVRLRELLAGRERIENDVVLTELIGVNPDPFQHQVILDKGFEDGVYVGQPVLDAGGVMGQVVEVAHYTNRTMLITDARHAIPVAVNRNGLRAIALGKGNPSELELEHVPDNADIRVGDLLISSALGERFPYGYPVAVVTDVERDVGRAFMKVKARPSARLDKSRYVLLVEPTQEQRNKLAASDVTPAP